MRNAKLNETVTCDKFAGDFKVINVFNNGCDNQVQIQSVKTPMDIKVVNEVFCNRK